MLDKLALTNVRNHPTWSGELGELTILVGPNGSGKTNVLEAISILSTTRSWRVKSESEIVRWGEEFARLTATADDHKVEAIIARNPYRKSFWRDDVRQKMKDAVGAIKTVLFQPDDLALLTGAPNYRRHFMNVVLSQSDHEYSSALLDYAKTVTQRNHLLKRLRDNQASLEELDFWDRELIRLAEIIWRGRASFVSTIAAELTQVYRDLSGDEREVQIRHETKPHQTEHLAEELVAVRDREIITGQTVRGPHRDDLHFLIDGHHATEAASRGELRSITFALKMMELDFLEASSAAQPGAGRVVLLLDDIMSELDANRRSRLVEAARRTQAIITTTDPDDIPSSLRQGATVIEF